jgi:hypothetical protein
LQPFQMQDQTLNFWGIISLRHEWGRLV